MENWARVYVYLARQAPIGVIIRRKPSDWVEIIRWHTDNDTFETGQWFMGRIYERRCDLSPDGRYFVYFASKQNPRTFNSDYTYAWTAVSRPPYLTALALYPKGDCWNGGGLFEDNRTLWLNHHSCVGEAHPNHQPPKYFRVDAQLESFGEDSSILPRRLVRDGWELLKAGQFRNLAMTPSTQYPVWGKRGLEMHLMDIDFEAYGGPYIHWYVLNGHELGRCTWAGWDQRGRCVVAKEGKLFHVQIARDALQWQELADLNNHQPQRVQSPPWARKW